MNKVALLGLALLFALCAGIQAEFATVDFIYHAKHLSGGKPMPVLTEWIFRHFASWRNGSVFCIFLIPWALLLSCVTCSWPADRATGGCPHCAFLTHIAIFTLAEIILCLIFGFAGLLPFLPGYRIMREPEGTQITAYIPQLLLLLVFAAAVIIPIIRIIRRPTNSNDTVA
jgi:hypothetical protein